MGGAGSKSKGGAFERATCKYLSLWVSNGAHDDLFWRSAMSGGRATVQFRKGTKNRTQAGDISAIHPMGAALTEQFLMDCKHYKDLGIARLLSTEKASGIGQFWTKCCEESKNLDKLPMLIAKQNFVDTFVCLSKPGVLRLRMAGRELASFPKRGMTIFFFDDLLQFGEAPL